MKKINFLMTAFALLALAACDDNNNTGEEPDNTVKAEDIAGTYNGYTKGTSTHFTDMVVTGESIVITANEDNTVDLAFTSKGLWGEYAIENMAVTKKDGAYTVSASGKVALAHQGATKDYDYTMTASIKSAADASIVFSIPEVMGGLTVTFVPGEAPYALLIKGSYTGYTSAVFAHSPNPVVEAETEPLVISARADGKIDLSFTSGTWGEYDIEGITVGKDGDAYTVSGSGKVTLERNGSSSDYDYTMAGSIRSATDAKITFTLPALMNGGTVIDFITGTVPGSGTEE